MREITVAVTQMKCSADIGENRKKAEAMVREAAEKGADIVLLQELFENLYFCQNYDVRNFDLAVEADNFPFLDHMADLAKELDVVIPVSFFEKKNNLYYNTVVVIDSDGTKLGKYRKSHIPDDPGYFEKFYFSPGDTGFKVWETRKGKIGIGICWDQWFPETARVMALMGAEILLYPTAIGFHTHGKTPNCSDHWQLTMRGHAAANMVPVMASNRIGIETGDWTEIEFFGRSFITDEKGNVIAEADGKSECVLAATFDLDQMAVNRRNFVLFRDRRPELYGKLMTKDGEQIQEV